MDGIGDIILNKTIQAQKAKYCMFLFIHVIYTQNDNNSYNNNNEMTGNQDKRETASEHWEEEEEVVEG
jgi:hypothetical protein